MLQTPNGWSLLPAGHPEVAALNMQTSVVPNTINWMKSDDEPLDVEQLKGDAPIGMLGSLD